MYIASDDFVGGTAATRVGAAGADRSIDSPESSGWHRVRVPGRHLRIVPERTRATTVLGVSVDIATEPQLLERVSAAVSGRRPTVFVGLYAALFRAIARDVDYRADVAASVTYPDGNGVVTELQRRGVEGAQRLATTDVVHPIMERAVEAHWRVGLYGASQGVAQRAAAALQAQHPNLDVVAIWHGYQEVRVDDVRAADLDVLLVGLGSGRQERWSHDVAAAAGVPAIMTCGGLFDFLAGDRRRAPRWMQRVGLEWAFRVMLEPRRLFVRYLLGNGYFLRAARRERSVRLAQHHTDVVVPSSQAPARELRQQAN